MSEDNISTKNPTGHAVIFTEQAACKVYELMEEEENLDLKLRVFITGGGCSGFQYGFTFDENIADDDTVVTTRIHPANNSEVEVSLLIDSLSFGYLKNAEIDYREDIQGAQFIIRNPDAKTTCGCGSSFEPKDDE